MSALRWLADALLAAQGAAQSAARWAMLLAALGPAAACAADHVLVMTISDYPRQALEGVKHDAQTALGLARKLGYDTRTARVLKDRQLTGAGVRAAFGELLARVQRNDRVFVYFSGHGYSVAQGGTCVQGLVAQDEALIPTAELSDQLDQVKTLVSDALVIFDACFSGGNRDLAVTRALGGTDHATAAERPDVPVRAKVWTPRGGERCERPSNELTKAWEPPTAEEVTRSIAFPKSNFTFIAAATEREVALDDRDRGGLATVGLSRCVDAGVPSADGIVTVRELAACAQQHVAQEVQRINAGLQGRAYLPHNLTVFGNADKVLAAPASPPVAAPGPLASAAATAPTATPTATRPPPRSQADRVINAFHKFAASSNGNWGLRVEPSSDSARIGQSLRLRYRTNQPGHVQLLYVGSDRKDITRIWPAPGQVRRVQSLEGELPVGLQLSAPAGDNVVLFVLSREPLDLEPILKGGSAQASPAVLQQLGCEFMRQRNIIAKEDGPAPGPCDAAGGAPSGVAPVAGAIDGYTARVLVLTGTP